MTDQTTHHAEAILRAATPAAYLYDDGTGIISFRQPNIPMRNHEGWTESPLYTAEAILAAVREAMEAERKAVMDWLRDEGALQIDSGYDAGFYGGQGMIFAAHEIARGVHLPTPPRGE